MAAPSKAELEPMYIEFTSPHVDARYGKNEKGRIRPVDPDRAARWVSSGIAKLSSQSAYEKQIKDRMKTGDQRAAAISTLNSEESAMWDVNARDAVIATPERLKAAMDAGMTITNTAALVDDDGVPLSGDASFDEIMNARENTPHPDTLIDAHEASSLGGGGSHYSTPVPERQRANSVISTDAPKRRIGRVSRAQVGNAAEAPEPNETRTRQASTGDTLGNVDPIA